MKHLKGTTVLVPLAALLAACSSGGGPSCSFDNPTTLADTTWAMFRADPANSGRAAVDLSANTGVGQVLFPPPAGPVIGAVQTTPILGPPPGSSAPAADRIFIGSSDGNVYVINYQGEQIPLQDPVQVQPAILGTPLLGTDGTLIVPSNGAVSFFKFFPPDDTTSQNGKLVGAASALGFVASSPNIWNGDGTFFVTGQSGVYVGVCPNAVARYSISFPATQSTVAVVQDPNVTTSATALIIAAGLNGQVRAYNLRSRQYWSFFASSDVNAAVLIDESTNQFYVADSAGRVFAGAVANGAPTTGFSFTADAGISASPALSRDTAAVPVLYIADHGGTLYAVDRATGAVRWTFQADGPILSSPAVATGGATDVIVFGATLNDQGGQAVDGRVYALSDEGTSAALLWTFDTGSPIGAASPSIGADGTVYIGRQGTTDGGAVYAIGPSA